MSTQRKPLRDAVSGEPLPPREQPGYYAGFSTMRQKGYWDATTRDLVEKRVAKNNPAHPKALRFFSEEVEADTMRAVVDRIVPQDDRTPERRIDVLAGLDERLADNKLEGYRFEDMPPDQEAYRIGIRAFNAMATELHGKLFAQLGTLEQEEILQSVHDKKPMAAEHAWTRVNIERFWQMLVADCVSVYYAHPWAWDEIGFGGPAYPRGYMRLEEGEPEPWEVDEQPYAWLAPDDTISDREQQQGGAGGEQAHHGQGGTH